MRPSNPAKHSTPEGISSATRRSSLKQALIVWGVWRSALSLWGVALWRLGIPDPHAGREWLHGFVPAMEGARAALIDLWMRWDTVHYLRIIQHGYGPDERSAFFPLYPYLGKLFGTLTGGDPLLGLLLVSNLAAIGCFYLLDQLRQHANLQNTPHDILQNLVFYPSSFFLLVAYPQSLVLLFSLASYLALRKQRLFSATIFGFAAGLTHSTALPLSLLLLVESLATRRIRWTLSAIGPLLGIACFLAWRVHAGFPSYLDVQWAMSGRSIGLGFDLAGVLSPWIWFLRGWPNLIALVMGIGAIIWAYRRQLFSWAWYLIGLLLIPVLSAPGFEPLDGLARYLLVGFPVYFAISSWLPGGWKRLSSGQPGRRCEYLSLRVIHPVGICRVEPNALSYRINCVERVAPRWLYRRSRA